MNSTLPLPSLDKRSSFVVGAVVMVAAGHLYEGLAIYTNRELYSIFKVVPCLARGLRPQPVLFAKIIKDFPAAYPHSPVILRFCY